MSEREITVFIGGPNDARDEHELLRDLIQRLAPHYAGRGRLVARHWSLGADATPAPAHADYQRLIDRKPAADCDIVFMVFRDKLGTEYDHGGRAYASSSAYELETALDSPGNPRVYVFRASGRGPESTPDSGRLTWEQALELHNVAQGTSGRPGPRPASTLDWSGVHPSGS